MRRDVLPEWQIPVLKPMANNARGWRSAVLPVTLCLLWTLAWYTSTAKAMAQIWARSDTFAHGFVVPLIVVWLVWRMRSELATTSMRPSWAALGLLGATGFVWLLGELASVNAVTQLALVAFLVLTVVAVLGTAVARKLAFPLGFLFFAVPIGEFMMPQLMDWTADVTVFALRLSGIPVYREGSQFVIPSGHWSVVEACSGVRYLIASLMVGTVFAYLSYRSTRRRLIFVAIALVVPIVANWLRAYMIVMLGHLSGNKLAVGVDHVIYGWLFFGVVVAVMFWIGAHWREEPVAVARPLSRHAVSLSGRVGSSFWLAAAAVAAVTVVWKIGYWGIERGDASAPPRLASINAAGEWLPSAAGVDKWRPHFEEPSAELQEVFRNGSQTVGLFVGYYRNQDYGRKLVSSENVLVKSSDAVWTRVASGMRDLTIDGQRAAVRTAVLRNINGHRLQVCQWYWINGRITASEYQAKAYTALSRLQGRGDDSAVIVVYAPQNELGGAQGVIDAFVRAASPQIEAGLRETRDRR